MTITEVQSLFARYKKDISDVSDQLFIDWCDEVNKFAYRIMYGEEPQRFLTDYTVNVVPNVTSYSLPADFLNIAPERAGVFYVNDTSTGECFPLPQTSKGSQQNGYYLTSASLNFTPVPQTSFTVYLRYIPVLDQLTALGDTLVIPDDFLYYVKYAVDALYDAWDEDTSAEGIADQRFTRALDELARNLRRDSGVSNVNTYAGLY